MALPKVCGIETEYGIVVRGADNNPVTASSLLINAYLADVAAIAPDRLGLRRRATVERCARAYRSSTRWHPRSRRRW